MKAELSSRVVTHLLGLAAITCATLLCQPTASATPSVVGLWRFNEASGTNAIDSSGLGNNGTLTGEGGNIPMRVSGQSGFGGALNFTDDGTNHSYVDIPGAPSLMIGQTATNAWSITAWAYENSNGTSDFVADYGRILTIDDGNALYFDSGASGDAEMYTWSEINAPWQLGWGVGSPVAPLLDQWVHWALVYDGTNLTMYRNANEGPNGGVSSMPVTAPLAFSGYVGAILIGSELDQPANVTWNGMLDDVAVFAGALTPAQVATAMSGDFSAFLGGAPGFVNQPQNQSVQQGSTVTFSAGVDGQAPFAYQWFFNGTTKLSGASNPTATNATLVLTNVQMSQAGTYTLMASNSLGNPTSQPATLQVFNQPLVGLWRFDEGSGTNALDSSGLGNTGALIGENGNVPTRVAGQAGFGGALRFTNNGVDHAYVAIPSNGSLAIGQTATNPWTITAWVYEDSDGTSNFVASYGRIMVIDDGTALQLESGAVGDDEFYTWSRANGAWELGWGAFPALTPLFDQWEHWGVVYDGTNISVYLNGTNMGTQQANAPLGGYLGYQDAIQIGTELAQDGTRNWNGMLDDVAIFNIALSQSQIQTVMSGDFSAFLPVNRPQLSISQSAGNVKVSWPLAQSAFQLQFNTNLAGGSWTNVLTSPVTNGNALSVTVPVGPGTKFFRLSGRGN